LLLKSFLSAIGFLTILPAPQEKEWDPALYGRAGAWYPAVGAILGLLIGLFFALVSRFIPASVAAALTVIGWVVLSGGLHWDGLSDCCDGFFYAGTPEKRLAIMKDVNHGTFAVMGIVLTLLLKFSGIMALDPGKSIILFPLIAALSRWSILWMLRQPVISPNGMASSLKENLPRSACWLAAILPLALIILTKWTGVCLLALAAVINLLIGLMARRKVGGINGDVLGLTVEVTEALLVAAAAGLAGLY